VNELKDEAKLYHKMVMETITKDIASLGALDVDKKLKVHLVDGIIYSFQEQTTSRQQRIKSCLTDSALLSMPLVLRWSTKSDYLRRALACDLLGIVVYEILCRIKTGHVLKLWVIYLGTSNL
jgi:hypothetical protein